MSLRFIPGAHLCAMALLNRAKNASSAGKGGRDVRPSIGDDVAMPRRFLGMSGVYDIQRHFEYEASPWRTHRRPLAGPLNRISSCRTQGVLPSSAR